MDQSPAPLDDRKRAILRVIVESYIRAGEPVGSKSVADATGLGISSATVRNEMMILEREGYISQPHTSAGRVPTDKGYRYYVDELVRPSPVEPERAREIQRSLSGALSALDDLLHRASHLLSELTEYTSLAAAPPMNEARLRSVELIPLGGRRVLLVLVGDGARHEERVLDLSVDALPEVVRRTADRARSIVDGRTPLDAASVLARESEGEEAALLKAVATALRLVARDSSRVFTGGTSRMISWEPATNAQRVLEVIEEGDVRPLLPDPNLEAVDVRIGRELAIQDLKDLSLIAAGYGVGEGAGSVGILGPTRMDYPEVMSIVELVARSVSAALRKFQESD